MPSRMDPGQQTWEVPSPTEETISLGVLGAAEVGTLKIGWAEASSPCGGAS